MDDQSNPIRLGDDLENIQVEEVIDITESNNDDSGIKFDKLVIESDGEEGGEGGEDGERIHDSIEETISDSHESDDIYEGNYAINDTFIIIFEDNLLLIDVVATLLKINDEAKTLLFLLDNGKEIIIKLNSSLQIILKTDDYTIIDIEKIKLIDQDKDLDELLNTKLTEEIFPELIIDTVEISSGDYLISDNEKREDFVNSIIQDLNITDDYKINKLYKIIDIFLQLEKQPPTEVNQYFKDINNFDSTNTLPSWIIPISNDYNRIYHNPDPESRPKYEIVVKDGYFTTIFDQEMIEILKLLEINNEYKNYISTIYDNKFRSIQSYDKSIGFELPYNKDFFLSCLHDSMCTSASGKYSIEQRKNPLPFYISSEDNYSQLIPQQLINITGFI